MINKFLELLANLLLGLLAILVPIFAVVVSVSARAIEDARRGLQQNITGTFADIDEIRKKSAGSAEATLKELRKAIRRYSWQKRKAQIQLFLLTTRAAVYYPGLLFLGALGLLLRPLSHPSPLTQPDFWLIYGSSALAIIGTGLLCGVLETVSKFASTYDPSPSGDAPNFSLRFANNTQVSVWPAGSKQQCVWNLTNTGDYLGETIQVSVFFPSAFQLKSTNPLLRLVPQASIFKFAGQTGVFWEVNRLHARTNVSSPALEVVVPAEKGEYVLPTILRAAKIRLIETKLRIIVS